MTTPWRRGSTWAFGALAPALLLVPAAWLASNWNDLPPQPRAAVLQLPSPSLPDARNAYFTLAGLRAAPDRDPTVAGQANWKQQLASSGTASNERFVPHHDAPPADHESPLGTALPGPTGPPLVCEPHVDDCTARWIDAGVALRAQRAEHAVIGARCERLLGGDFAFDEVLAPMRSTAEPVAQHAAGASTCSLWFRSGAVLAWTQHDRVRAVALLNQADRLNRALLEGSHSLIGQMIAIRTTRDTLNTAAALVVRDPSFAPALAPLLAPLPDAVRGIRRWMVVEAAFQRGAILEIERRSTEPASADIRAWFFRRHIGWHPERTMQSIDARWLRSMQWLDGGLEATMRAYASEADDNAAGPAWRWLTWVNPIGSVLADVANAAFGPYLARHADLALHHDVTTLAVNLAAAGVPAAQRRAWTAAQPLAPAARERIAWSDDGSLLRARTWQETAAPQQQAAPRDAISVAWPATR